MGSEQDDYDALRCYTLAHTHSNFIHQHVVDAYIAQHADEHTKPIGLTFALVGLYLCVEKHFDGRQVQRVHMELAKRKQTWPPFVLPAQRGSIGVTEVMAAPAGSARDRAIHAWCASVWSAFDHNRQAVIDLLRQRGYEATRTSRPHQ